MENSNRFQPDEKRQTLQIWSCGNCDAVHFKAGNALLNFTKEEFTELAYSVNDLFQEQFGSLEFYNLINLVSQNEDALLSDTRA